MKFTKRDLPTGDGNGGIFLKLKDGESVTGVPRGEIYEFYRKWESGRSKVVTKSDPEGRPGFRMNFVVYDGGKFVPKVWEFGLAIYNQLADLSEEYDLEKTKIKVTRRGTGTDTVYMTIPLLKEPIPSKVMKEIEAVPLNILEHKDQPPKEPKIYYAPSDEDEEIPF